MALNRKQTPELGAVKKLYAQEPEIHLLSNGIPVHILEAGDQEIIRLDIVFQAGSRYQNKIFQAGTTNSLLTEGTTKKTAREIADNIDFYGSYLNPGSDRDEAHIQLYSLNKFLAGTLDITADIIKNPVFPEKELDIHRDKRLQTLAIESQKVDSRARKIFIRNLFGPDHPYGQIGEAGDLINITRDDLKEYHAAHYHPRICNMLISGKDASKRINLLEERFGKWTGSQEEPASLTPVSDENRTPESRITESVNGAVQSAIRIGGIMPVKTHEDFSGLSIANTILGGFFGSRLMQNIREDKGYTYGIGSSIYSLKEKGIFLISTDVGQDYYLQTIQECFKEIEILTSKTVSDQELSRVRQHIEGEILRQLDGPFNLAESYRSLMTFGLDFSFLKVFLDILKNITPQDILSLSKKYFLTDQMLTVVSGTP